MRSYSETRWAATMDALSVTWLYEPHKIKTRHGLYKPDFFLPTANAYVEVKGPRPTTEEIEKAHDTEIQTGSPVFFLYGRPQLISGELVGGMISYAESNTLKTLSTQKLGALIKQELEITEYWKYVYAGRHTSAPPYKDAHDVISAYLATVITRDLLEKHLESQHRPLNKAKTSNPFPASKSEMAILFFKEHLK